MPIDVSGWSMDNSQNPALYKIADTLQDNVRYKQERDFRNQRIKEQDDWKKLQLIQELSNVDKYQTGDSVADALGNMKASEVLQKYTALAGSMSPAELQYKISQDIQNTAAGMQGFKDEMTVFSNRLPELQKMYPSLSTKALEQKYREDIIGRRIKDNEFANPTHIDPPRINIDDPETLADFMQQDADKIISKEIVNPQIYQTEHRAKGNRDSYTKFTEKLSPFAKSNLTPESYNADMFLKSNVNPSISFDSTPEDIFGTKVETLSKEAYKAGFSPEANIAFISMAKKGMPQWSKMTSEEKDKSVRAIALDYVKKLDKSGYSFENANPPAARTSNTINMPGSGGAGSFRDAYNRILKESNNPNRPNKSIPINELNSEDADVVVAAANRKDPSAGFNYSNIFVKQDNDGVLKIYKSDDGALVTSLTEGGVNVDANKPFGVKEKRAAESAAKTQTNNQPKPTEKYSFNGVTGTYQQLLDAFGSKEKVDAAIKDGRIKKSN